MSAFAYILLLSGRLVLAGVFGLAGAAKLVDRRGARRAMVDLGVPAALAAPGALLLPVVELSLAVALVFAPSARLGAVGVGLMLGVFSLLVARTLGRGETPDCHCFGQVGGGPIGRSTLVRNGILAAVAVAVAAGGAGYGLSEAYDWLGDRPPAERVLLVGGPILVLVIVGLGRVVLNLLGQQGRLLLRIDALEALFGDHPGVPLGAPAPVFTLPDLDGHSISLDDLRAAGRPVLVVFADPYCGPCGVLMPELVRWQHEYREVVTICVVSRGDPGLNRAKAAEHGLETMLLQRDREVAKLYSASATPSAVLIDQEGRVAGPLVAGGLSIWRLLLRAPHAVSLRPPSEPWPRISDEVEVYEER